jgi:hypothetical protein
VDPHECFPLYVCRTCRAWALAPEEISHSGWCPGRSDESHIDYVIAEPVSVEPYRP